MMVDTCKASFAPIFYVRLCIRYKPSIFLESIYSMTPSKSGRSDKVLRSLVAVLVMLILGSELGTIKNRASDEIP